MLLDRFQRPLQDLRISVTDRCNFRCLYCMPLAEYDWLAQAEILSYEEIERLTRIRGIGHWTAQMFLMFSLGRPDVFPHGDLGIRSAIRKAYGLDELPDRQQSEEIARPWHPHATIASWYLWRSLEN